MFSFAYFRKQKMFHFATDTLQPQDLNLPNPEEIRIARHKQPDINSLIRQSEELKTEMEELTWKRNTMLLRKEALENKICIFYREKCTMCQSKGYLRSHPRESIKYCTNCQGLGVQLASQHQNKSELLFKVRDLTSFFDRTTRVPYILDSVNFAILPYTRNLMGTQRQMDQPISNGWNRTISVSTFMYGTFSKQLLCS